MRRIAFFIAVLGIWLAASIVGATASEPARIALLIGNQAYQPGVGRLKNPLNDIKLLARALKARRFDVRTVPNASLGDMTAALSRHARRVRQAGAGAISFVYYSGHGAQDPATRTNYLIPVDATSTLDTDLWDRSLPLSDITRQLKRRAGNATHFVIFDACRNALRLKKAGVKAVVQSKGFIPVAKVSGMLIAYATAEGKTASDVGDGAGPYARALAEELAKPGVEAVTMFRNVQLRLYEQLGQEPWLNFGYFGRVYFGGKKTIQAASRPKPSMPVFDSRAADLAYWNAVKNSPDAADFKDYIAQFPQGIFVGLAKRRLRRLENEPDARKKRKERNIVSLNPELNPKIEKGAFEAAERQDTIASYRKFLTEWPNGWRANVARQKIRNKQWVDVPNTAVISTPQVSHSGWPKVSNAEIDAFVAAERAGTVVAFEQFIAKWPTGWRKNVAMQKIRNLKWIQRTADRTTKAEPIWKRQSNITKQTAFSRAEEANTVASYKSFLETWSSGWRANVARQKIRNLEWNKR